MGAPGKRRCKRNRRCRCRCCCHCRCVLSCCSCCSAASCQLLLLPLFLLLLPFLFLFLPFLSASFSSLPSCLSSRSSLSLPSTASPPVAAAGVAGCWGDCLLLLLLPRALLLLRPASPPPPPSLLVVASPLPWLLCWGREGGSKAPRHDKRANRHVAIGKKARNPSDARNSELLVRAGLGAELPRPNYHLARRRRRSARSSARGRRFS